MLKCFICGYEHPFMIAPTHIKKHGLSTQEYKEKFPGVVLRVQTNESKEKMSKTKLGIPSKIKGIPKTKEHTEKVVTALKEGYKEGKIKHWNLGNTTPNEVKQKISLSNKNRINNGTTKQILQKRVRIIEGALSKNCSILNIDTLKTEAQCNICDHIFSFSNQVFYKTHLNKTQKLCPLCEPRSTFASKSEKELADFIESLGLQIIRNDREQLGGKEIDVYIPSLKIGFEFTGLYWHAEKQNPETKHLLWKKQFAHNQGIRLITIFEDEWLNKLELVKSRIKNIVGKTANKRYFARKCELVELKAKEYLPFLEVNHLQGKTAATVAIGLKYDGELVSVMTFKKSSFVKGASGKEWELSRFASKKDILVIGAASKLLNYFKKKYAVNLPIISFADSRWSDGDVYKTLGFMFAGVTPPSYWYTEDYKIRHHRSKFMKHIIISKLGGNKSKTEWENMREFGYDRIWDCGNSKWIMQ